MPLLARFEWYNLWKIISEPDNLPIVGMLVAVIFFLTYALRLARRNDRIRAGRAPTTCEKGPEKKPPRDLMYPAEEERLPERLHAWPFLVRLELLLTLLGLVVLILWSLALDAPLEEPSDPNVTPNPSKAPWYFLGLQELLVYFDPWLAGVAIPAIIIVGLMLIPYLDVNPRGSGYYTLRERPFAIATFCYGFLVLWVGAVIVGTFLRGPGWMLFVPGEKWTSRQVLSRVNVNLSEFFGLASSSFPGVLLGLGVLLGWYLLPMLATALWLRRRHPETRRRLGRARFVIVNLLFWTMLGITAKIILHHALSLKYVLVTPWFNI